LSSSVSTSDSNNTVDSTTAAAHTLANLKNDQDANPPVTPITVAPSVTSTTVASSVIDVTPTRSKQSSAFVTPPYVTPSAAKRKRGSTSSSATSKQHPTTRVITPPINTVTSTTVAGKRKQTSSSSAAISNQHTTTRVITPTGVCKRGRKATTKKVNIAVMQNIIEGLEGTVGHFYKESNKKKERGEDYCILNEKDDKIQRYYSLLHPEYSKKTRSLIRIAAITARSLKNQLISK